MVLHCRWPRVIAKPHDVREPVNALVQPVVGRQERQVQPLGQRQVEGIVERAIVLMDQGIGSKKSITSASTAWVIGLYLFLPHLAYQLRRRQWSNIGLLPQFQDFGP